MENGCSFDKMAEDVPKQTRMMKFNEAVRETKQKIGDKRRKFRHCKSAPVAEYVPGVVVEKNQVVKPSETIFPTARPSLRKVAACLCIYMAVSVTCFYLLRNQIRGKKTNGVLDSVYFCVSTLTASGYTDLIPNSTATKLLACACVFSGTALIGLLLSNAADYLVEKQEELFVRALSMRRESSSTLLSKKIEAEKIKSKCIFAFVLLLVLMAVGTIFLVKVEKMDLVDAFYCVCSIITTLGYVDKSFSTKGGRVFAIFWVLTGTICLAQLVLYIAELRSDHKQKKLVDRLLSRRMTKGDLEAADLDDDGVVKSRISPSTHNQTLIGKMEESVANQPLLMEFNNAVRETNQKVGNKYRRFRRCKSAPRAEYVPGEVGGKNHSLTPSETIFDKLHPNLRKVAMFLCVYMVTGVTCFYIVRYQLEGKKTNGILDSVYFCIVTMTTVGYGDLVPNSPASKLLACVFVFSGMALVGLVLSKAADYLVEKQEALFVRALNMQHKASPAEIFKKIETEKVRYKCIIAFILLLVLIVSGTVFLVRVEKLDLVDAFYCVCSTITTLGYGDKSFSTKAGRIFAIFWILTSTICLAQFFLYIAELHSENKQRELVKRLLSRRMTIVDLEAADLDDDGLVGAAEFVIYKLKEMGKITEEDILPLMDQFENLDVDQSGTLSATDLTLAQGP
ncbi:OLC1v1022512C1 [Oldenlandia corymbosa var. corymbosa]|uniref:OLC1v1022512C1 n=1 Tax=Oldenlandia corymbosa var. corymbosa TaxID=529605 RepID=A0AAV1BZD3_OLDCO|nr:OLC1v1022512C1 [Oldenlandia corymbosa var. corymbosa]